MTDSKGTFIAAISEGQPVTGIFLVKELSRGETKAGKPFLRLTLADNSGEISGPIWDDAESLAPLCQPGSFLKLSGRGESYRGTPQLRINQVAAVSRDEIELADFMPSGEFDRRELEAELAKLIAGVQDAQLSRLLAAFFNDPQLARRFATAPAAKAMHHAYLGGLMEHTVTVANLAVATSRLYPGIDRDLLLTGALLHDVGKTEELTYQDYPFGYSNRGRLVGHLVIGAEMIREKAAPLADFPAELTERLQHLILSHHGRHEFGTPTLPMMQEAFVLHFLDDLDAKVNYFGRLNRRADEPGYQWSEYQRNLERFLYLRGPEPEAAPEPAPTDDTLAAMTAAGAETVAEAGAETVAEAGAETGAAAGAGSGAGSGANNPPPGRRQQPKADAEELAPVDPRQKGLWG